MPATLSDLNDLAVHPKFVRLCQASAVKAAVLIGNEEYDGSQYRIMRRALSTKVLVDPDSWGPVFSWACATNPVITLDSAEESLDYVVATVWDALAGAIPETQPEPEQPDVNGSA